MTSVAAATRSSSGVAAAAGIATAMDSKMNEYARRVRMTVSESSRILKL
jgi:hypothetical protein